MTWQAWIVTGVSAVCAVAFGVWRHFRGRRLDRVVSRAAQSATGAERAAASAEARTAARKAADVRSDARAAEGAGRVVEAVRAAPPAPDEGPDGVRAGRRPRSSFADELGLD